MTYDKTFKEEAIKLAEWRQKRSKYGAQAVVRSGRISLDLVAQARIQK